MLPKKTGPTTPCNIRGAAEDTIGGLASVCRGGNQWNE